MKKIIFLLLVVSTFNSVNAQIVFTDLNFKNKLISLGIDGGDGEISEAEASVVRVLNIENSNISNISGIEYFSSLRNLLCSKNQITSIDMSNSPNLTGLSCFNNKLTNLNLSLNNTLTSVNCVNNLLPSLDLSNKPVLKNLFCDNNRLTSLNVSNDGALENLYCSGNLLAQLNTNDNLNLKILRCSGNSLGTLNVSLNTNLDELSCSVNQLTTFNIVSNLNLKTLNCANNPLTALDVSMNANLETLRCQETGLTTININNNLNLKTLDCSKNPLTGLNVSLNTNLESLFSTNTGLTSLNVASNLNLKTFYCDGNLLGNLNVTSNAALLSLHCYDNQLTSLDVSNNAALKELYCGGNKLTVLDVSSNTSLQNLTIQDNLLLTRVFMKNSQNESLLQFNTPNLRYICADESQLVNIQNSLQGQVGTVEVNSCCSFAAGGTLYTIKGNSRYDENTNGCDPLDISVPNLKFNITDGTNTGSYVADVSGNYSISVQAGTHNVTPVFVENPSYFNISPTSFSTTFPATTSPFIQDICVTPNGVHPDLEISVLPLTSSRPGFDAGYKIIYKNKGTTTQTATVNFTFNDAILDLVSANPITTQTGGNLSWTIPNLRPFESGTIYFTLNLNSPVEIPAVNGGDVLNYTATITSQASDETPIDNTFTLMETVFNSYDPNDKTCLEGKSITPNKIGEYVHYMIRFENTGTANAQNIVVKDVIDLQKFDINSIVPLDASHSFVTKITETNKVEFIFENIQLPFDNATNDGYIAFKIKTLPTLVSEDTFSNTASIYFDYNFPIVTNIAITTIKDSIALANNDFELSSYFTLYPNPASEIVTVNLNDNMNLEKVNIYNTLGQLVKSEKTNTINVNNFSKGNYYFEVITNKGKATKAVIVK